MSCNCPKLAIRSLLGVVAEFRLAFGANFSLLRARPWVRSILRKRKQIAVLSVGSQRNFVWTKEDKKWKVILQTPESPLEIMDKFRSWKEMSCSRELKKEGVDIRLASRSDLKSITQGADDDMLPP